MSINIIPFRKLQPIIMDWMQHPAEIGCMGLIAEPGIGKTSLWRQCIRDLALKGSYFNAGMMSLADLLGCATPNQEFTHTLFLPHMEFDPEGHVLVDELTNAPDRGTFTGLSNLLLEGRIPGHPHTYNKSRMFACNPTGTSDLAEDLPRILVNRSVLYGIEYEYTDFLNYALNEGVRKIHPVVAAFIQETRDNYLHVKEWTPNKKAGVDTPAPNSPFPTPRAYELLSDRLWRMERGVPTSVFEEGYATVGEVAGKHFGDYYSVAKYLPKVSNILDGQAEDFPQAAFKSGKVLGPLQMMVVFSLLASAQDQDQFVNGCTWLFAQLKKETVGRELLRTFADAAKDSIHKSYQHDVLNALGSKAMGGKEWTGFLLGSLKSAKEASNF